MTEPPEKKAPWWRAGLFAAVVGAAIPVATLLQGWQQKGRELELQELQQAQQIRVAYMNLLVEGGLERVQTLAEFIADTDLDPRMRQWAADQKKKALEQASELKKELADSQKAAEEAARAHGEAEARARRAEAEARRLAEQAGADREARARAEKEAEQARAKAAEADREVQTKEAEVDRTRETLQGRPDMRLQAPIQQLRMSAQTTALPPAATDPR